MADESAFIELLKELLSCADSITKEESDEAISLIKSHFKESKRLSLRVRGVCLHCKSTEIDYDYPCQTHQRKGDAWLDEFFSNWKFPPRVEFVHRELKINGYSRSTIEPYVCDGCVEEINALIEMAEENRKNQNQLNLQYSRNNDWAIIKGERRATTAKRYWTLLNYVSQNDIVKLKEMPYKDFLQTHYWEIVRNYVVYKRGHRCELCAHEGNFNVHHKTYEHHGEEHHHLEDLILLCRLCHAKFHDKLAEIEGAS